MLFHVYMGLVPEIKSSWILNLVQIIDLVVLLFGDHPTHTPRLRRGHDEAMMAGVYFTIPSISGLLVDRHSLWELKVAQSVVSVSITCRLRSYRPPQRWIFSVDYTCIVRHVCLTGYLFWEKTTFCSIAIMSLIILVWWTGMSSFSVSPGIVPYPLERVDGGQPDPLGLIFVSGISKLLLDKFSLRGLSAPDDPRFSHSSSISIGFDYILQSPCSGLLFHYLVRKFTLVAEPIVVKQWRHWCKQFIMVQCTTHTHVPSCYVFWTLTCHKMSLW